MTRTAVTMAVLTLVCGRAETISPLSARGYTVLPHPQIVKLGPSDFKFSSDWNLEVRGVPLDDAAVEVLKEELDRRFLLKLANQGQGARTLHLVVAANSARVGDSQDRDRDALARQAYKIESSPAGVTIAANTPAGLYYGVVTFVQLFKPRGGTVRCPG